MLRMIKQTYERWVIFFRSKYQSHHTSSTEKKAASSNEENYFLAARSWADDTFTAMAVSRHRYRCTAIVLCALITILLILLCYLIPIQHLQPLIIHHYTDGRVTVDPVTDSSLLLDRAQLENDLVRYVVNRESYDPMAYADQYHLILWMSDSAMAGSYIDSQRSTNSSSLIHQLGSHRYRTVHIDNVVILDEMPTDPNTRGNHHNLAEVHAVLVDHSLNTSVKRSQAVSVIMSWEYTKPSMDPDIRWRNWDGFQVTHYQKKHRNWEGKVS